MQRSPENANAGSSFEDTAKDVIRNSIRSAICIDDRYAAAYEENPGGLLVDEPRKLHKAFREDGLCDLDIYRFTTYEDSWKPEFMLSNKDLLILDWELDAGGNYDNSIKILTEVVQSKKIPFVVVYTSTADLNSVSRALLGELSPYDKDTSQLVSENLKMAYASISDDDEAIEVDLFLEENVQEFYEYLFSWKSRSESEGKLLKKLRTEFKINERHNDNRIKSKGASALQSISIQSNDFLSTLAMVSLAQESENKLDIVIERLHTEEHAFRINGTIVLAYHKQNKPDGIRPENLFSVFANAIVSNPNNYLSLLSLELKDQLRESFSVIGARFSKIDEQAFFYHLNNYRTMNGGNDYDIRSIYDFILKTWIGELHQQKINEESEILKLAQHRYDQLNPKPPINISDDHEMLKEELVKYCALVSTTKIQIRADSTLRFGDIFINEEDSDEFYLCITPACDCLHPSKINHNFFFVKGMKYSNKLKAIQNAEKDFLSFVLINSEPQCIQWICKPFTSYIVDNDIERLKIAYGGSEIKLAHLIVLKENYTQRIANESFGWGYRVGIDLPH